MTDDEIIFLLEMMAEKAAIAADNVLLYARQLDQERHGRNLLRLNGLDKCHERTGNNNRSQLQGFHKGRI